MFCQNVQSVKPHDRNRVVAVSSASMRPRLPTSSQSISVRSFGGSLRCVVAKISPDTLRYYQTQLRASISSALSSLDSEFEVFINERKADVTNVLTVNGKITSRADERFSRPGAQFLLDFAATLRGYGVKDSNVLLDAVDKLASAKLSYRGFNRIRRI